jgi:hypothetical protein
MKRTKRILTFSLLALSLAASSLTNAAIFEFKNFMADSVAAIAFPYGATNWWTNQTVTNNGGQGSLTNTASKTNGWYFYQHGYMQPTVWAGTGVIVGTPPTGTTLIGGAVTYITNLYANTTNINPALANYFGTNEFFIQWLAGQTNAAGSQVTPPVKRNGVDIPVETWGIATSNVNATLTITFTTDSTTGTNLIYFPFVRTTPVPKWITVPNGGSLGLLPNLDVSNVWTVTSTCAGTNQVTVITNVPVYMLQGANSLIWEGVLSATNIGAAGTFTGTNIYVQQVSLEVETP